MCGYIIIVLSDYLVTLSYYSKTSLINSYILRSNNNVHHVLEDMDTRTNFISIMVRPKSASMLDYHRYRRHYSNIPCVSFKHSPKSSKSEGKDLQRLLHTPSAIRRTIHPNTHPHPLDRKLPVPHLINYRDRRVIIVSLQKIRPLLTGMFPTHVHALCGWSAVAHDAGQPGGVSGVAVADETFHS